MKNTRLISRTAGLLCVQVFIMLAVLSSAWAVQPNEVLDDPILEERARELSKGLRCLVCRNESIDESNADLARDLRLLVRERLIAGETNNEVLDFIVDRYGEYVLLKPEFTGSNWVLYAAGPLMFLISLGLGIRYVQTRQSAVAEQEMALSDEENARLDVILKK